VLLLDEPSEGLDEATAEAVVADMLASARGRTVVLLTHRTEGLDLVDEVLELRSGPGSGRPLILLHGGLGSGEMFGPVLPALAERHQVSPSTCRATVAPQTSTGRSTSGSWPTTSRR
jgi:energy-coupling factor transporter ATP-binding protein EcfA2